MAKETVDRAAEVKELAASVFADVCQEYEKWERRSSMMEIKSLQRKGKRYQRPPKLDIITKMNLLAENPGLEHLKDVSSQLKLEPVSSPITGPSTSRDPEHIQAHVIPILTLKGPVIEAPFLEPCAPYESCAPAFCNDFLGNDPEPLPFIPFADDRNFPLEEFSDHWNDTAWQNKRISPEST